MTGDSLPSLKLVVAWSDRRNLCTIVESALTEFAGETEVRRLSDEVYVVHAALTAAELRDHVRGLLDDGDAVFVAEFEVWSGYGQALDSRWLLARGH